LVEPSASGDSANSHPVTDHPARGDRRRFWAPRTFWAGLDPFRNSFHHHHRGNAAPVFGVEVGMAPDLRPYHDAAWLCQTFEFLVNPIIYRESGW
jgi:hypothetical protein